MGEDKKHERKRSVEDEPKAMSQSNSNRASYSSVTTQSPSPPARPQSNGSLSSTYKHHQPQTSFTMRNGDL